MNLDGAAVRRAREVAQVAHKGQVDKAGGPYIEHPAEVADRVRDEPATVQVVAWLHDVVEDTLVTVEDIESIFGSEASEAVDAITRRTGESPRDYYARVAANPIALRVKEADLGTNTDPWRTRLLEPFLRERLRVKYEAAYLALGLRAPLDATPPGRLPATIGDVITRGRDQAIVAWVGTGPADAVLVFTACLDGQFRGTAATAGTLAYHGWTDEGHLYSVPGDWTVTDRMR